MLTHPPGISPELPPQVKFGGKFGKQPSTSSLLSSTPSPYPSSPQHIQDELATSREIADYITPEGTPAQVVKDLEQNKNKWRKYRNDILKSRATFTAVLNLLLAFTASLGANALQGNAQQATPNTTAPATEKVAEASPTVVASQPTSRLAFVLNTDSLVSLALAVVPGVLSVAGLALAHSLLASEIKKAKAHEKHILVLKASDDPVVRKKMDYLQRQIDRHAQDMAKRILNSTKDEKGKVDEDVLNHYKRIYTNKDGVFQLPTAADLKLLFQSYAYQKITGGLGFYREDNKMMVDPVELLQEQYALLLTAEHYGNPHQFTVEDHKRAFNSRFQMESGMEHSYHEASQIVGKVLKSIEDLSRAQVVLDKMILISTQAIATYKTAKMDETEQTQKVADTKQAIAQYKQQKQAITDALESSNDEKAYSHLLHGIIHGVESHLEALSSIHALEKPISEILKEFHLLMDPELKTIPVTDQYANLLAEMSEAPSLFEAANKKTKTKTVN